MKTGSILRGSKLYRSTVEKMHATIKIIQIKTISFCKEVLQQLPMEFAVEAQKLVGISLEGSVG